MNTKLRNLEILLLVQLPCVENLQINMADNELDWIMGGTTLEIVVKVNSIVTDS